MIPVRLYCQGSFSNLPFSALVAPSAGEYLQVGNDPKVYRVVGVLHTDAAGALKVFLSPYDPEPGTEECRVCDGDFTTGHTPGCPFWKKPEPKLVDTLKDAMEGRR